MSTEANKVIYSMIGVSKHYDKKPVLQKIYLSYFYGAKIGVLGLNGSGKSSLLRILAGRDEDFSGETVLAPGFRVGLLEQEPLVDSDKTVLEVVQEGVQETVDLLAEFEALSNKLGEPMDDDEMMAVIDRQAEVQEKIETLLEEMDLINAHVERMLVLSKEGKVDQSRVILDSARDRYKRFSLNAERFLLNN